LRRESEGQGAGQIVREREWDKVILREKKGTGRQDKEKDRQK